jgi:predicted amidohydrolase
VLVLAGPGGVEARYAKIHPFSYSGEDRAYEAGAEHAVATVGGVRVALFVCYDLRFADEFWALAPTTDAYVVVANWPSARVAHWSALLRARAIENQAYVVGVNRVGTDGNDLPYDGESAVIDPMGVALATATAQDTMILADLDPSVVATTRARFPFLADRR